MTNHQSSTRLHTLISNLIARGVERESVENIFKRHDVAPKDGVAKLVDEIERDGGSTLVNIFRGGGVSYAEIVLDVAEKLGAMIPEDKREDEIYMEQEAYYRAIATYFQKDASDAERKDFADEIAKKAVFKDIAKHVLRGTVQAAMIRLVAKEIGQRALSQAVRGAIERALVSLGLRVGGGAAARVIGIGVPILNAVLAAWLVADIAGPATRKTIPTVLDLAYLRMVSGND